MIKANIAETPVVVFQNFEELRRAEEAVKATDYALSEVLGGMASDVKVQGFNPESSRIVGSAAAIVIDQLTRLSKENSLAATHAQIILEDATNIDLDVWPEPETATEGLTIETAAGHSAQIQVSTAGPISAVDLLNFPTGVFVPELEWLAESRTVPLEVTR